MNDLRNDYHIWLCSFVYGKHHPRRSSYDRLLETLGNTEFSWTISKDENRAADGKKLREDYADQYRINPEDLSFINDPCSILEMMIALSNRMEKTIMSDPDVGDKTGQWFWTMIANLHLGPMTDLNYSEKYVDDVIDTFLSRHYARNGDGGLFIVNSGSQDMRRTEIWYQMSWYLDEVLGYQRRN